jgi:uncharacterized protein (DUF433 family)
MFSPDHSPITASAQVLGGTLVFRGTRVPAHMLLDYLHDDIIFDENVPLLLHQFFPTLRSDAQNERVIA